MIDQKKNIYIIYFCRGYGGGIGKCKRGGTNKTEVTSEKNIVFSLYWVKLKMENKEPKWNSVSDFLSDQAYSNW